MLVVVVVRVVVVVVVVVVVAVVVVVSRCKLFKSIKYIFLFSFPTDRISIGNLNLKTLVLHDYPMVTDGDLKSLVYHNHSLTELHLSGCNGSEISDVGVEEMAKWFNASIRTLDLAGIARLTSRQE